MHPTFMHKLTATKHTQTPTKHTQTLPWQIYTYTGSHTHKYTQTTKKFPSIAKAVSDSFQMHPIF